jgi:hypothetical protein
VGDNDNDDTLGLAPPLEKRSGHTKAESLDCRTSSPKEELPLGCGCCREEGLKLIMVVIIIVVAMEDDDSHRLATLLLLSGPLRML